MYHDTKVPFAYVAKKTGDDLKKNTKMLQKYCSDLKNNIYP